MEVMLLHMLKISDSQISCYSSPPYFAFHVFCFVEGKHRLQLKHLIIALCISEEILLQEEEKWIHCSEYAFSLMSR